MTVVRKEDGAVLVEFALVLVPLLLIVIGMMQFGILLNARIDATHLTSTGARYAVVNQNPGDADGVSLQEYIKSRADTGDMRSSATVCVDFADGDGQVGDPVRVSMSYTYDLLPFLGDRLSASSITVVGDAVMRLEALPEDISPGCTA